MTLNRTPPRERVENFWSLDAGSLAPLLADPGQSTWIKLRRGNLESSIRIETIDAEHIELHFKFIRWGPGFGDSFDEDLHQPLALARVARRRGERTYFVCPECRRHRSMLYARPHFSCRVCHRLAYASQRQSRNLSRLAKALRRRVELGGRSSPWDPFPRKPTGMRRKTYERLRKEDFKLIKPYLVEQILRLVPIAQRLSRSGIRFR